MAKPAARPIAKPRVVSRNPSLRTIPKPELRANAKGEGRDRKQCKTRRLAQGADGISQVLHYAFERRENPHLSCHFLYQRYVAEVPPDARPSVLRRLPGFNPLLGFHREVSLDFIIEISVGGRPPSD